MALASRNDRCPCGSGKKYKRCCIEREPELVRRAKALEELGQLPALFPLLRPQNRAFEEWLAKQPREEPSDGMVEEGIKWVARRERKRIAREHAQDYPLVWESLVADVGDERLADAAVVAGAVSMALRESQELYRQGLELIEELDGVGSDLLALDAMIDGMLLWSVAEVLEAQHRIAQIPEWVDDLTFDRRWQETVEREAAGNWTHTHERRLFILVKRVRDQLPVDGYTRASAVLAEACARFESDNAFRQRLAVRLLADTLELIDELHDRISLAA